MENIKNWLCQSVSLSVMGSGLASREDIQQWSISRIGCVRHSVSHWFTFSLYSRYTRMERLRTECYSVIIFFYSSIFSGVPNIFETLTNQTFTPFPDIFQTPSRYLQDTLQTPPYIHPRQIAFPPTIRENIQKSS